MTIFITSHCLADFMKHRYVQSTLGVIVCPSVCPFRLLCLVSDCSGVLALSHHHLHLFFVSNIVIYCLSSPSSVWRLWPLNMPKTFPHLQRSIFVSIQFESERFESYRSTKLHMITLVGKTRKGKGDEVRTAFFPLKKKMPKMHNLTQYYYTCRLAVPEELSMFSKTILQNLVSRRRSTYDYKLLIIVPCLALGQEVKRSSVAYLFVIYRHVPRVYRRYMLVLWPRIAPFPIQSHHVLLIF